MKDFDVQSSGFGGQLTKGLWIPQFTFEEGCDGYRKEQDYLLIVSRRGCLFVSRVGMGGEARRDHEKTGGPLGVGLESWVEVVLGGDFARGEGLYEVL